MFDMMKAAKGHTIESGCGLRVAAVVILMLMAASCIVVEAAPENDEAVDKLVEEKGVSQGRESITGKKEVVFRVRVVKISPAQPAAINWSYGGQGLGGEPVTGSITSDKPEVQAPAAQAALEAPDSVIDNLLADIESDADRTNRIVVKGSTVDQSYLMPGVWSKERPVWTFGRHRGQLSVTFSITGLKTGGAVTNNEIEFEFSYAGKLLRRFSVEGSDGPVFGVMIPFHAIGPDGAPKPSFSNEVVSLREYAQAKQAAFRQLPWIGRPTPRRYAFMTSCGGYGTGGFGTRTSDRATVLAEFENMRFMGMNGTVGVPDFVVEMRRKKEGLAAEFRMAQQTGGFGYMIPMIKVADGVKPIRRPGDGCPYFPSTVSNLQATALSQVEAWLKSARGYGTETVLARTVDEIGCVFDGSPEGKGHPGGCPYCAEAFREFVRADGRTLADFGAPSWDDIRSTWGYWRKDDYFNAHEAMVKSVQEKEKAFEQHTATLMVRDAGNLDLASKSAAMADDLLAELESKDKPRGDVTADLLNARKRLDSLEWTGSVPVDTTNQQHRLSPEGWHLLGYYSAVFTTVSSGRCFDPLRKAFDTVNARKREALARGETDTPAATQPWIQFFCLRGNTFLLGGHSLDFFEFYRYADTAFFYETSNRDRRVWQWDSYLCDVGRSLSRFMGKQFGIYIKPHRGAPVQRALAAMARGARWINWYAYGPEWAQGDSFGGNADRRKDVAWAARLIAGGEDVTYESDWAVPAEVAVVRPLTSEKLSGSASYENAKWVYTALMHTHIPMDALDEGLLMSEDLSRYKAIVISGCHVRRDAAEKLAAWVAAGGTLCTSGWGMARDEAGRPLENLLPVFGLKHRGDFDAWGSVPGYGATSLGAVRKQRDAPEGAVVTGSAPLKGTFTPVVGREVLDPAEGTEVVARYADGGAAVTRHKHGKGTAWAAGPYAGVEYAWETMNNKPFDADKRSFIAEPVLQAGVRPVVDASDPLVEGHMLKNSKTGALAVVLINWAFHIETPVTVTIRGAGAVKTAESVATGSKLPLAEKDGLMVVSLPRLDEGEILLLRQ